jgi:hypothetical protein
VNAALMLFPRSHRNRTMRGAATHVAVSFLALAAVLQSTSRGGSSERLDAALQLARTSQAYQSRWRDTSNNSGGEVDKPMHGWRHHRSGVKTGAGGYSPQRVRGFWSNFHGARKQPKETPLEKQPREAR